MVQHDEYATRSTQNRVRLRRLPPPRGLIYDRNGVLLADNVPAFRLDVVPERVKDMDAHAQAAGHDRSAQPGGPQGFPTQPEDSTARSRACR